MNGMQSINFKARQTVSWLAKLCRDKRTILLLLILGLGAYLRVWNIDHIFNAIQDYDEAAYTLGARFIYEGYLPYRDFILVHPPFYNLVLAALFKVFGYSFFYAKYLSVFISLASIVLIYFTGRKIFNSTVGIVVAALFAVSPDMIYSDRRAVQGTLGIFLILIAVYFFFSYLSNKKNSRLFICGLAMGLAVATKYIFAPAVIAIFVAALLILMGDRYWKLLKKLGSPSFLLVYLAICACVMAVLFVLTWSLRLPIPIPFFTAMITNPTTIAVTIFVFVVPLLLSILVTERNILYREWGLGILAALKRKEIWYMAGGTIISFLGVTGYFWINAPYEFINQTILMQNRPSEFPALVAMIRTAFDSTSYVRMAYLPIILALPLAILLLNKRYLTHSYLFISVSIIVGLIFCQNFPHLTRYNISIYPFIFLGIASIVSFEGSYISTNFHSLEPIIKAKILSAIAIFALFLSTTMVLLTNYSGYDSNYTIGFPDEEEIYQQTIAYLESASPNKIYSVNPVYAAISTKLKSTRDFDTFAYLWLKNEPAPQVIQEKIDEGVDYVVLDYWVRFWRNPYQKQTDELVRAVRSQFHLVKVIAPESMNRTEIYIRAIGTSNIFNGNFDQWVKNEDTWAPLGWQPSLTNAEGYAASITKSNALGKPCVKLSASENGIQEGSLEATYSLITQKIKFPQNSVVTDILMDSDTRTTPASVRPTGIHFVADGHALIFSFSSQIKSEQISRTADGNSLLILRPIVLGQWSLGKMDIPSYWSQAGWEQPEQIEIYLIDSAYYSQSGVFDFYIASIQEE